MLSKKNEDEEYLVSVVSRGIVSLFTQNVYSYSIKKAFGKMKLLLVI